MGTHEKDLAGMEAHMIVAANEYFDACPHFDDVAEHLIFEAGFKRGWKLCTENLRVAAVSARTSMPAMPIGDAIEKFQQLRKEGKQMIAAVYYCE